MVSNSLKVRRFILAGAVTSITIAGTLYGAGIKTDKEVTQTAQKSREATIDERIAALRGVRENLSGKKHHVEKQLQDLEARVEEKKQKGVDVKKGGPPIDG